MISAPPGVRVWLAGGVTDMRCGMNSLLLRVQQGMGRNPHDGDLFVFRGRRGHLIKLIWADRLGVSLYSRRLEHGRFIWPTPADGVVEISAAQMAYLLDGIDWRSPKRTWKADALPAIRAVG